MSPTTSASQRWVTVPCAMCTNECGIQVRVEAGRIVDVKGWDEHPYSRGHICIKARRIPEHVYHDARLKYPLQKTGTGWRRISWDEALETIASRLSADKERYGPASLGVLCGEPVEVAIELGAGLIWRFCDVYGTPSRFHTGDLCCVPLLLAQIATLGRNHSPDVENSKCVIVWADNPAQNAPATHKQILNAKRNGAKVIVVDPRRISLSKQADLQLRPRLGTDGILLLAMINTIIAEQLYDREFVEHWTVGFDRLAERVAQYTVREAERVSGVPAADVVEVARLYAATKPACIQYGFRLHQCRSGFQNSRSLAILQAITGNIQVTGGDLQWYTPRGRRSPRLPDLLGAARHPVADKYPIYPAFRFDVEGCMTNWTDLVVAEPRQIRNMIISGANPAITWPNSAKVRRALDKLDFLVVMDVMMTDTAKQADIVLPACTFLEKLAPNQWRGWCLRRPVIEPQWESWPDSRLWIALGGRMGYQQYFPWQSDTEVFDYFYETSGLTVQKILEEYPEGFIHPFVLPGHQQYRQKGFRTPSGKVELYSARLEQIGLDPLPSYLEPLDSPLATPQLFHEFPLQLATGTRELEYYHSEHRHLDRLRRRNPEPRAEIHPATALRYGIEDGEPMIVETKTGSLELKARLSEDIAPDMISVPHGWPEAPENMLTDDAPADPVSGYAAFTSLLCRVKRATPAEE